MSLDIDPELVPDAWDIALIGPYGTPGLVELSQGGVKLKWDKKPGFGTAIGTTKLTGIQPGEFTLKIRFVNGVLGFTSAQQRFFYETQILPLIETAKTGKQAIPFYHPAVSEPPMRITAVVPEEIGIYEQDNDGVWSVTIKFSQFGKPKAAAGTPKSAAGKTVLDANEQKIKELTADLKALAD